MIRLDPTNGANHVRGLARVMSTLPRSGGRVGYAAIGLAVGEDAGGLVEELVAAGRIDCRTIDGAMSYARARS